MGEIIDFAARKRARESRDSTPVFLPSETAIPTAAERESVHQFEDILGIRIPAGSAMLDDDQVRIDHFDMSLSEYRRMVEESISALKERNAPLLDVIILVEILVAKKRVEAVNLIPNFSREHKIALGEVAVDTYGRGVMYESEDLLHTGALMLTKAYGPTRAGRVAENIKIKMKLSRQ